ncbi:MAG: hypothetical protein NTX91_00775 [candidate division SR1 bacterium]|nr:hypothetical protein [candidate division SR1 bacterium]
MMPVEEVKNIEKRLYAIDEQLRMADLDEEKKKELINELQQYFLGRDKVFDEIAQQKPIDEYSLEVQRDDVILTFGEKKISLQEEFKAYSGKNQSINFFVPDGLKSFQYLKSSKEHIKTLAQEKITAFLTSVGIKDVNDLADYLVYIPGNHNFQPFCLACIAHELGHFVCNDQSKNLIEKERNAHTWGLRFIRNIERKYGINTHIDGMTYNKMALASYQTKYLLHQHDQSGFLETKDDMYVKQKDQYTDLGTSDRTFL